MVDLWLVLDHNEIPVLVKWQCSHNGNGKLLVMSGVSTRRSSNDGSVLIYSSILNCSGFYIYNRIMLKLSV